MTHKLNVFLMSSVYGLGNGRTGGALTRTHTYYIPLVSFHWESSEFFEEIRMKAS